MTKNRDDSLGPAGDFTLVTTYDQAVAFLDSRIGAGIRPGLESVAGLLDLMASPHLASPVIHVAGTNGKTTTVHMIDVLIQGARAAGGHVHVTAPP